MTETEQDTYREHANQFEVIFEGERYADLSEETKHSYYLYLQEALKKTPDTDKPDAMEINEAADMSFRDQKDNGMRIMLRLSITALPLLLILISFTVLNKKFIIDESMYEKMTREIRERKIA
jgi:hypothetical protein